VAYWDYQVVCTRCRRQKAKLLESLEAVKVTFDQRAINQWLAPKVLADWKAWATNQAQAFRCTSSAVEGRNDSLSELHHHQRGLLKQRYKVWTILHNFDYRASNETRSSLLPLTLYATTAAFWPRGAVL
jgi:hypothetical protein